MKEKTCCFTGHRILEENNLPELMIKIKTHVIRLHEMGVTNFLVSDIIGFESLVASEIVKLKPNYPGIKLLLLLPYKTICDVVPNSILYKKYCDVRKVADEVVCIKNEYFDNYKYIRNNYIVENSSYLIYYLTHNVEPASTIVNYAKSLKLKEIINLNSP